MWVCIVQRSISYIVNLWDTQFLPTENWRAAWFGGNSHISGVRNIESREKQSFSFQKYTADFGNLL